MTASSQVAAQAGMPVHHLLLTEVAPEIYELHRKTASGHELAARPPDDHALALPFAEQFAGDTPLWFVKLADRGGPPILVPKVEGV